MISLCVISVSRSDHRRGRTHAQGLVWTLILPHALTKNSEISVSNLTVDFIGFLLLLYLPPEGFQFDAGFNTTLDTEVPQALNQGCQDAEEGDDGRP